MIEGVYTNLNNIHFYNKNKRAAARKIETAQKLYYLFSNFSTHASLTQTQSTSTASLRSEQEG